MTCDLKTKIIARASLTSNVLSHVSSLASTEYKNVIYFNCRNYSWPIFNQKQNCNYNFGKPNFIRTIFFAEICG